MKKARFTFKREPKPKGNDRIWNPNRGSTIKHNGHKVGTIYAPGPRDPQEYVLAFQVQDATQSCGWRWVRLKQRFPSDEAARGAANSLPDSFFEAHPLKKPDAE